MGSASSIISTPLVEHHITMTLQMPNVIAIMDSEGANGVVYNLIRKEWTPGIEGFDDAYYVRAFRINEKPFAAPLLNLGKAHINASAHARQAFCHILGRLDEMGIRLVTSLYAGKMFCRSTLFFERISMESGPDQQAADLPCIAEERFVCVTMRSKNILQFPIVDGLGRLQLDWIRTEFSSKVVAEENMGEYWEFILKGQPFGNTSSRYEEMITAKRLFLGVVRHFSAGGYEFAVVLSIKGGYKNDTMFFKCTRRTPDIDTNYFLVCPEERNRLRLFEAPKEVAQIVEASIPSGQIKEVKPAYMGCTEIVFTGQPFDTGGAELAETQLQFLEIIDRLWQAGWELKGALQTALGTLDRSSLLFASTNDSPRPMFGLALCRTDTIKLYKITTNIHTLVRELILGRWTKGIQLEFEINCGYGIKLKGRPFGPRDVTADSHEGLHLLACIVEKLKLTGWELRCCIDVGAKLINEEETHAYSPDGNMMIFVKEKTPSSAMQNRNGQIHGAI